MDRHPCSTCRPRLRGCGRYLTSRDGEPVPKARMELRRRSTPYRLRRAARRTGARVSPHLAGYILCSAARSASSTRAAVVASGDYKPDRPARAGEMPPSPSPPSPGRCSPRIAADVNAWWALQPRRQAGRSSLIFGAPWARPAASAGASTPRSARFMFTGPSRLSALFRRRASSVSTGRRHGRSRVELGRRDDRRPAVGPRHALGSQVRPIVDGDGLRLDDHPRCPPPPLGRSRVRPLRPRRLARPARCDRRHRGRDGLDHPRLLGRPRPISLRAAASMPARWRPITRGNAMLPVEEEGELHRGGRGDRGDRRWTIN